MQSLLRWSIALVLGLLLIWFFLVAHTTSQSLNYLSDTPQPLGTITLQLFDACNKPLPGAIFDLVDASGKHIATGTTEDGKLPAITPTAKCPAQRGSCPNPGCLTLPFVLPTQDTTYTIVEMPTLNLSTGTYMNPPVPTGSSGYTPCYGPQCSTEVATVHITTKVIVSAQVQSIFGNGHVDSWPDQSTYAGTMNDPIIFHNSPYMPD